MKEIKFRAWDTKKQIFVPNGDIIFSDYGDTRITVNPNCMEYIGDSCHNYNEDSRFKIMQYTGLKDKNGVEIYEGDIMMAPYMKKKPCVVEYSKTLAKFTMSGKFNFTSIDSNLEVIGNIYENKELLA